MTELDIFDIQHCCLDDGPGIRTVVFLKGCPLRCIWCHNPEGLSRRCELSFSDSVCTLCGMCAAKCKTGAHIIDGGEHMIDRARCILCGDCTSICAAGALKLTKRSCSYERMISEIMRDEPFYRSSGGGVTFSGGEPFYQGERFISLLCDLHDRGVHTCIETSGFASRELVERSIPYTDLYLFDCKETDEARHIEFTGQSNHIILENLTMLSEAGCDIVLRCPVIPTKNATLDHARGIGELSGALAGIREIHLEPYHSAGISKARSIGIVDPFVPTEALDEDLFKHFREEISRHTDKPIKVL